MRARQLFGDDLALEQHGIRVSTNFVFLDTVKEICEAICDTYSMKKNVSRVFEMYEDLFSLRQDDKSLKDYYIHFKGMIDKLNRYHPVTNDIEVIKKQLDELYIFKFLSELSSQLKSLRGHLLAGEEGFSLCRILSHDYFRLEKLLQKLLIPFQLRALS